LLSLVLPALEKKKGKKIALACVACSRNDGVVTFLHTLYLEGGGGSHEVFPLSSLYFILSFVFGYLTWPHCRDPFFIFTIVMFMGGVGVTSHTPRIYFS